MSKESVEKVSGVSKGVTLDTFRHPPTLSDTFRFRHFLPTLLFVLGHFLSWAQHRAAALTQSAHDLAISTHFTPGAGVFANEWFFAPIWCAALLLALFLPRSSAPRLLLLLLALGIASLGLPMYPQVLTAYRNPDYRVQFFITLVVMLLIVALSLAPPRLRTSAPLLLLPLALLSAVPLIGYLAIRPAIEDLYRDSLGIGVGWWVTLAATIALLMNAGATIMSGSKRSSSAEASRPA